jgi:hypothetical protein
MDKWMNGWVSRQTDDLMLQKLTEPSFRKCNIIIKFISLSKLVKCLCSYFMSNAFLLG